MATDLTKEVPKNLRAPMSNPEILTSLLPNYFDDSVALDYAIGYIQGALQHQNFMREMEEEDIKAVFPITLDEVEVIERKTNSDWVLGKKVRLHFEGKKYKSDKIESQSIDTGWTEYNGWNVRDFAFEIALANTLAKIAEDAVGKKVFIRKVNYETSDGEPARFLGDIWVPNDQDDDEDNKKSSKSSGSKSKSSGKSKKKDELKERIDEELDDIDEEEQLTEEDVDHLYEIFTDDPDLEKDDVLADLSEYLDIEEDELEQPKREKDPLRFAIKVILENIED